MHADELEIDVERVRRLVASQFPEWADRPIRAVLPRGTDNALYRLGDDLVVRLPCIALAYYTPENDPVLVHEARRWLREALAGE